MHDVSVFSETSIAGCISFQSYLFLVFINADAIEIEIIGTSIIAVGWSVRYYLKMK